MRSFGMVKMALAGVLILGGNGFTQTTTDSFASLNVELATTAESEPLVLQGQDVAGIYRLDDTQLESFLKRLDAQPMVSAEDLPWQGKVGTYFSLQHPNYPPWPCNPGQVPVWSFGGFYLMNDVDYDYTAAYEASRPMARSLMSVSSPPDFGDSGGTNGYTFESFNAPAPDYGTNLWIAQVATTNGYLTGIGSNTLADVQYEIRSCTNLLQAQNDWQSEGFIFGSEVTNWTPLSVAQGNRAPLFIRLKSWADDESGLPIWWQQQFFSGTNGVDPYGNPAGDGWSNLQKFQKGWSPNTFYTPAAPQGVTAYLTQANQAAVINWLATAGNVTGFAVEKSYQANHGASPQLSTFTTTALSYQDSLAGNTPDAANGDAYDVTYRVRAHYSSGAYSDWSPPVAVQPPTVFGLTAAGTNGEIYLVVKDIPANAVVVRLVLEFHDFAQNSIEYVTITNHDIPVSSFVNGRYVIPPAWQNAVTDATGYVWFIPKLRSVDANGNTSAATFVGGPWGSQLFDELAGWQVPFYDGRVQLKQNLIFQLRIADTITPFGVVTYSNNPTTGGASPAISAFGPADYVYAGFYDVNNANGMYGTPFDWPELNIYRPFQDNALYRNFAFTPDDSDADGNINTGIKDYSSGAYFDDEHLTLQLPPLYQPTTNVTGVAALLGTNTTQWLATYSTALLGTYPYNYYFGCEGFYLAVDGNNEPTLIFSNNAVNYWGLPFASAKVFYVDDNLLNQVTTMFPGHSLNTWLPFAIYMNPAQPQFQTVEYDFWNSGFYAGYASTLQTNLPGNSGFSITNQSKVFFAGVAQSVGIAAYAKLAVLNGYPGVYGYLQQYLDKAYQIDSNGNVTTNLTGIVSPYGNYFATEIGAAAIVTMPDVDTGARGTGIVYSVALQLDKNHDGVMDLAFNGADATSPSSPFVFWRNNNFDRWLLDSDDDTSYEDDAPRNSSVNFGGDPHAGPIPDYDYVSYQYNSLGGRAIPTQRDLEDYTRLWICGVTTNLLTHLPTNSTVTLNWGDVGSPNLSNPTIDLFKAVGRPTMDLKEAT